MLPPPHTTHHPLLWVWGHSHSPSGPCGFCFAFSKRSSSTVLESTDSVPLLVVKPWASYLIFLCLSFFMYKHVDNSSSCLRKQNMLAHLKYLELSWLHSKCSTVLAVTNLPPLSQLKSSVATITALWTPEVHVGGWGIPPLRQEGTGPGLQIHYRPKIQTSVYISKWG